MELQLRLLSRELLKAQEEERKQISRDLHDEIIQVLVGINVNLAALSMVANLDVADLCKQIGRTQRIVEKAVNIVHRFARELRPGMLDDLGLIPALEAMCQEFNKRTKLPVTLESNSKAARINSAKQTVIFRITQAALSNIQKHSGAGKVHILINETAEFVQIQIHDDGKSFDVDKVMQAKKYKRLGLIGSRERVEMVGGTFEIISSQGNGTTVHANIPLDPGPKPTRKVRGPT
jgi:signal transduction histidine kinase